jgi:hypothetical protein
MTKRLLELQENRGWFADLVGREALDPARASRLAVQLVFRKAARMSGRYLHTLEDLDELRATG